MVESGMPSRLSMTFLSGAAVALALTLGSGHAFAQSQPSNPAPLTPFAPETLSAALQSTTLPTDARQAVGRAALPPRMEAPRDRAFNLVLGSFFTAASSDLAVSMYQIGRGAARERGFGSWWQDQPVVFATSKSAMAVAFGYGLQRLRKSRPKTALVMGVVATSVEGWLVVRNARMTHAVQ